MVRAVTTSTSDTTARRVLADSSIATVTEGDYKTVEMSRKEVYKFATSCAPSVLSEALSNAGVEAHEVDWLVLHQANIGIMETVAKKLGIPMEKVITNLDEYGTPRRADPVGALAGGEGQGGGGDVIAVAGWRGGAGECGHPMGGESRF